MKNIRIEKSIYEILKEIKEQTGIPMAYTIKKAVLEYTKKGE